ncbi:MAG: hypothetical protein KGM24_06750, partial [Elusimicrobia bacterium]|nr:hypothetical protein [Elusimicrobiota bacterium]
AGLRDSVAAAPAPASLEKALARASGAKRRALLSRLPGMEALPPSDCATLSACSQPELERDVADAELLPDALRRLVRPWMLLQKARGSALELKSITGPGDAVLAVRLKGRGQPTLTLHVTPGLGGYRVWYAEPFVLASLYGRERDAALKSSRD